MAARDLLHYRIWLTAHINSSAFNTTVSPFAQRSQQYLKEQLGQAHDKARIPILRFVLRLTRPRHNCPQSTLSWRSESTR